VGQFAVAIGSARGFEETVSFGHISALGREGVMGLAVQGLTFQNLVQTDAAINLGNSGGPLCNISGEVVGINTAIVYGANSIGFAIPINTVKTVIPELIAQGKVTRGYLGVGIEDVTEFADALGVTDGKGAVVKQVKPNTPADKAQIKVYDVIRKVNGEAVADAATLIHRISSFTPGTPVTVELWRDEKPLEVTVELQQRDLSAIQPERDKEVLGIRVHPLTAEILERLGMKPEIKGVIISDVKPDSPAVDAKLGPGDVILEVAKKPVLTPGDFYRTLAEEAKPGKALLIRYARPNSEPNITVLHVPEK
jgi:serine protease Do